MNNSFYQSTLFEIFPHLVHGYSTRKLGDMQIDGHRSDFLQLLGISPQSLVMPEQVHGSGVEILDGNSPRLISSSDGLVVSLEDGQTPIMSIGVIAADCVPILLADRKGHSMGVVHAGWKGSLKNISRAVVSQMVACGSSIGDIYAVIGPHISMCCYTVTPERASGFLEMYGEDARLATMIEGTWHMDIGYVNWLQLKNAGIPSEHIDAAPSCTSCQHDTFYSYRRDTKSTFGEILGVIGTVA